MKTKHTNRLWGSGFSQKPSEAVIAFTAGRDVASSKPADYALLPYDILVNTAHCHMLAKRGLIPNVDAQKLVTALGQLEQLVKAGTFTLDPSLEDVHTNIESWLTEKLGITVAGKLHTARSRNDQVATDTKLYLKDHTKQFIHQIASLTKVLTGLAQEHVDTIHPGFTHYQHAMVTTLGHTFAGFASMLLRDAKRLAHWIDIHDTSPLGSVASYGTTFPIDSAYTADLLGFKNPTMNSMDAITNRWEAESDLVYGISVLMNHLSSLAQNLIVWSTPEFGFVKFADQFTTGSSIMPQKKNPDPLEVIKGKASFVAGSLTSLLGIGKANFIGFNRDTQWTKYIVMDVVAECMPAPAVMAGVLQTMTVHKEQMAHWCGKNMIGATSLLEQLSATFHIPFREAKVIVEKAIKYSNGADTINYGAMKKALKQAHRKISVTRKQVRAWQDPVEILQATHSFGGPGKQAVLDTLALIDKECQTP